MKINERTVLVGQRVILVPYLKEHVPKYHDWMKSEYLQTMTESEPLTLEEEFEMQQEWHMDEHKCTFIILDKSLLPSDHPLIHSDDHHHPTQTSLLCDGMCGDVNLFLHQYYDEEDHRAEIEVMIAEETSRRKGLASESVQLMMEYGRQFLHLKQYEAKILQDNLPSLDLFENKLHYKRVKFQQVFNEWILEYIVGQEPITLLNVLNFSSE